MEDLKIAVVGIGATGAVLAASLLSKNSDVICVDPMPGLGEKLTKEGIKVSGIISYQVPVRHFFGHIADVKDLNPDVIFLSTKTYHLLQALDELTEIFRPGIKIISTHNGLGTEDVIAEKFGADAAFRMSLNYGAAPKEPGDIETTFWNKPNYLGCLSEKNREVGLEIGKLLTDGGLDTELVDDIKLSVWKKMIHKCSLASICAVTDRSIQEILDFPPTREIADACFEEAVAVAKASGYDLGDDYIKSSMSYLEKVGAHKDSMCQDFLNKTPTEIDFLGGKVVEYGQALGVPTPFFVTMTNLVKSIEDSYLKS
jgi:2-dehydropantoate 2-reductase